MADAPNLTDIVHVLSATYTDEGVLIWLNARNKHLPSKSDGSWFCSLYDYIAAGLIAEVYEVACRIEGGVEKPITEALADVGKLIAHAKQVSPSDQMIVKIGELEHALGSRDEPAKTRTGSEAT
jgi:hypothetical protein